MTAPAPHNASLPFVKMQGLGNDFVVLDGHQPLPPLEPALLRRLADRRQGVGCDQILVVDPAPHAEVDFGYRIYNADGSTVGQCGNGARCLALYVARTGLSDKAEITVQTATNRMQLAQAGDGLVRVRMPVPDFRPAQVPLRDGLQAPLEYAGLQFGAVSMGNPHLVTQVEDVATAPVNTVGAQLAVDPLVPEGANVGFAELVDAQHIRLRVYERGAGETPACGSGACGAVAVLIEAGRLPAGADIAVDLPGGRLWIRWDGGDHPLWMTGPAEWVYEGRFPL